MFFVLCAVGPHCHTVHLCPRDEKGNMSFKCLTNIICCFWWHFISSSAISSLLGTDCISQTQCVCKLSFRGLVLSIMSDCWVFHTLWVLYPLMLQSWMQAEDQLHIAFLSWFSFLGGRENSQSLQQQNAEQFLSLLAFSSYEICFVVSWFQFQRPPLASLTVISWFHVTVKCFLNVSSHKSLELKEFQVVTYKTNLKSHGESSS